MANILAVNCVGAWIDCARVRCRKFVGDSLGVAVRHHPAVVDAARQQPRPLAVAAKLGRLLLAEPSSFGAPIRLFNRAGQGGSETEIKALSARVEACNIFPPK
jgi:hypothetical protein